ncbi:MAG TPA: ADOP family duplicated permease [Acidobacteriaceae bacterium]|jgi:predicted permease|nr:ADOP family duplicated permease [Acidobacteriaceae bacterium]
MRSLWRLRALFRRRNLEREFADELDFHVSMREQLHREEGMSPAAARRATRLRFGNPVLWHERLREVNLLLFPLSIWQDLRFGARVLLRHPGFTVLAIFALGLGIGIDTATFTAYQAFFARKLDARDPSSMVNLAIIRQNGETVPTFSVPDYDEYRAHLHSFSGVIASSLPKFLAVRAPGGVAQHPDSGDGFLIGKWGLLPSANLSDQEQAMTLFVSDNYFSVLGVRLARGRTFAGAGGGSPAVMISQNYWHKRFDDDPNILGKTVLLNGTPFTIVGVTPHNFVGASLGAPDFWVPLREEPLVTPGDDWLHNREQACCHLNARLAPGVTMAEARAEITLEANQIARLHDPHSWYAQPQHALVWPGSPFPIPLSENSTLHISMLFIMAAVGLVLVVACANVAALQLARAAARHDELAMRLSLGASRTRLIRQLLTESSLLAVTAGGVAFLFSWAFLQALVVGIANAFPEEWGTFVFHVRPDLRIFAFVLLLSLAAGVFFGLAPALDSSRSALGSFLKANATTSPRRTHRLRSGLVAVQVAISSVLVIAGSLLIHSAIRAVSMATGYDDAHTIDLTLHFPTTAAYTPDHEAAVVRQLRDRLTTVPGIVDATVARAPDDGNFRDASVSLHNAKPTPHHRDAHLFYTWVQPNYFRTLGIPLLLGHGWTANAGDAGHVAVVSESTVRALWPGRNPLGRKVWLGTDGEFYTAADALPDGPAWQVIGVSRDTRGVLLDGTDSAQIYLPLPPNHLQDYPLLVRTRSSPLEEIDSVATAVAAVDPDLDPSAETLEQLLRQTPPFLAPAISAIFASITGLLGLVLAAVGIYGTVSYIVVLRTREVGIRMALGAERSDILSLILRESTQPVVVGLSVGVVLAVGAAWLLRHVLYGIHTIDGISFAGVVLLFLAIALLAALVPSRRALHIEPVTALRYE